MSHELLPEDLSAELWGEETWDELLGYIEDRRVIPIIGPDLLQVEVDGSKTSLDRLLAKRLADKFRLPIDAAAAEPTLNEVVCRLLGRERRERRERVYSSVCTLLKEAAPAPPEPLRQLAQIRHFNLFVTTTFDSLLIDALNEARFGGRPETVWLPNKDAKDLTDETADLRPTVYYLMGKVSMQPNYVLTEEDLLETVCELQAEHRRPARLFEELEKNHLLILGANFSDWLARIFLRTAKQRRLSDGRDVLEILADSRTRRDTKLLFFLHHFSDHTLLFPSGGAVDFVAQLTERWNERNPKEKFNPLAPEIPPASEMPPKAIFISYAHEDAAAVKKLKAGLDAAGLTAWYDKDQLKPGHTFRMEIENYITRECACFVSVISKSTEKRLEGFFRKEWHWAVERDRGIHHTKSFIVPVVVDDTTSPKNLDAAGRFAELHLLPLAEGEVTPEFIERMRQIVQRS
jgi:hypothetical protein